MPNESCPHCRETLPRLVDAFCPYCRGDLDELPAHVVTAETSMPNHVSALADSSRQSSLQNTAPTEAARKGRRLLLFLTAIVIVCSVMLDREGLVGNQRRYPLVPVVVRCLQVVSLTGTLFAVRALIGLSLAIHAGLFFWKIYVLRFYAETIATPCKLLFMVSTVAIVVYCSCLVVSRSIRTYWEQSIVRTTQG